jgi:hypothetical protein
MRVGEGGRASLRYSATVFQLAGANSGPRNLSYQFLLGGPEGKGIFRLQQRQAAGKNNSSWWLRTITSSQRNTLETPAIF